METNFFILIIYLVILLAIGLYSLAQIKTAKDFFVGGKKASVFTITGSLLATVLGSSAILGSVDRATIHGWSSLWVLVSASFGFFILYFLLPRLKDFKGYNVPELLGDFYGKEIKQVSALIISWAWLGIIASQILGGASLLKAYWHFTLTQGVIISGLVIVIYTLIGGQLSILKTDRFQLLILLLGLGLLFTKTLPRVDLSSGGAIFDDDFSGLDLIFLFLTYSVTFIFGPDIYSRIFCAKDLRVAKRSVLLTGIILLPLAFILTIFGIYAGSLGASESVGNLLLLNKNLLGPIGSLFLLLGLLSALLSSADTTLFTSSSLLAQSIMGELKDKKSIFLTRIMIIFMGFLATMIALYFTSILKTLFTALSIYSGAFIIPLIWGIFAFKKPGKLFLFAGIIGGGTLGLLSNFYGSSIIVYAYLFNLLCFIVGMKFVRK